MAQLIINHCNFPSMTAILPLVEVHNTMTRGNSESLIGYIPISLAAATSKPNQSLKDPGHTISTMKKKPAAFLQAKAHQTMAGAPALTPFIKIDFTVINGTRDSSDLLVSRFPKDWLFTEKAQNYSTTNRNMAVDFYCRAAEFAATATNTILPSLRLQHCCQITTIMGVKPWRPQKPTNKQSHKQGNAKALTAANTQ